MSNTREALTDAQMEHAFQLDCIKKLIEVTEKIKKAIEEKLADAKLESDKKESLKKFQEETLKHIDYLLSLKDSMKKNNQPLKSQNLETFKANVNAYSDIFDNIIKNHGELKDKGAAFINSGLEALSGATKGTTLMEEENLRTARNNIIDDFTSQNKYQIKSQALIAMNNVIFKNGELKPRDALKMILRAEAENKNQLSQDGVKNLNDKTNRIKLALKSHIAISRHHPELRVLKLISELKEGSNNPEAAKFNSIKLDKIQEICKKNMNDNTISITRRSFLTYVNNLSIEANKTNTTTQNLNTAIKNFEEQMKINFEPKTQKPINRYHNP